MSYQFKRILIYSIQAKSVSVVRSMIDWLSARSLDVCIYSKTAELMGINDVDQVTDANLKEVDLIMVIGGDGSMLSAANKAVQIDIPIFGINTGKLGFLVDHHPDDLDEIDSALKGNFFEEKRTLLSIKHGNMHATAMNEIIISPQEVGRIMALKLYLNDALVCQYLADGLIIATPTGSTAHAMSAGGAIIHPETKSFLVIPVCPHKLTSRPIVIPEKEKITVEVETNKRISPYLSCDGRSAEKIDDLQSIQIEALKKQIRLIHQKDYSFYETLKRKLHWERTLDA